MQTLINFWHNHVQKTLGWFIGAVAGVDIMQLFGFVGMDLRQLLGPIKYATVHFLAGLLIAVRAHQASNAPKPLPPPAADDRQRPA
jgi:hypothetical protein